MVFLHSFAHLICIVSVPGTVQHWNQSLIGFSLCSQLLGRESGMWTVPSRVVRCRGSSGEATTNSSRVGKFYRSDILLIRSFQEETLRSIFPFAVHIPLYFIYCILSCPKVSLGYSFSHLMEKPK